MVGEAQEMVLRVQFSDAGSSELDRLTRNLRAELLDTPIEDVEPVSEGRPPPGAKALDAFAWSALRLLLDPAILRSVLDTLVSWVRRNEGASLHLSAGDCLVELKGAALDAEALQKMLEVCLSAKTTVADAEPAPQAADPSPTVSTTGMSAAEGPVAPEPPPLPADPASSVPPASEPETASSPDAPPEP